MPSQAFASEKSKDQSVDQAPAQEPAPAVAGKQPGADVDAAGVNKDVKLDKSEDGQREAKLAPFFDAMKRIASEVAPQFKPLGLTFKPEVILAVAMQESGGDKDPANSHSFDNGLGIMQITPYQGQLDENLAKILNWDNSKSVEFNVEHSKWRDADANIRAGALELLNKANAIKSILKENKKPELWDQMDESHKWRAVSFAYNAGQGSAAKALLHGGPNAPMISSFEHNGKTISHDYTAEMEGREQYIDKHDPFSAAGAGGGGGGNAAAPAQAPEKTGAAKKSEDPAVAKKPEVEGPAPAKQGGIKASVGQGGANSKADVTAVQQALAKFVDVGGIDGLIGPKTIAAIKKFQSSFMPHPDGLIEPGKQTSQGLFGGNASASA